MLYIILKELLKGTSYKRDIRNAHPILGDREIMNGITEGMKRGLIKISGGHGIQYHITQRGTKLYEDLIWDPIVLKNSFEIFRGKTYGTSSYDKLKLVTGFQKELSRKLEYIEYELSRDNKDSRRERNNLVTSKYEILNQINTLHKLARD